MPACSNYGANPLRFKDWYIRCSKVKGFTAFDFCWIAVIRLPLTASVIVQKAVQIVGCFHKAVVIVDGFCCVKSNLFKHMVDTFCHFFWFHSLLLKEHCSLSLEYKFFLHGRSLLRTAILFIICSIYIYFYIL